MSIVFTPWYFLVAAVVALSLFVLPWKAGVVILTLCLIQILFQPIRRAPPPPPIEYQQTFQRHQNALEQSLIERAAERSREEYVAEQRAVNAIIQERLSENDS